MDYGCYTFGIKDKAKCIALSVGVTALAAWLLYQNWLGMLLLFVIYPFLKKYFMEEKIEQQKRTLLIQFKDAMQSVSATLLSGYSLENAWKEAEKEMQELYGHDAYMTLELKEMNMGVAMNQPLEELLYQFSLRSQCEEILSFAEILRFAKRSGGNLGKIIQRTTARISDKLEMEQEIATVISGKKMEQKVMNIVPVALLGYLNLTSGDFMAPLYGNLFGGCVMSIAFIAYAGALALSQKMMKFAG